MQGSNKWSHKNKSLLNAPRAHTNFWLKTTLHNSSNQALIRWLAIEPWRLNQVDAYFLNPNTKQLLWHEATGLVVPIQDRTISNGKAIIPIRLNAGETQLLFIKIRSDSLPFLSIKNWEPVAYTNSISGSRIFQATIFAAIVTLLIVLVFQLNAGLLITGIWLLVAFVFETEKDGFFSNYLLTFLGDYSLNLRVSTWILTEQLFLTTSVFLLGLHTYRHWRIFLIVTALPAVLMIGVTFLVDGNASRNLGILITSCYAFSWLFMLLPALRIRHPKQMILLLLLFAYWAFSSFLLLGYTFNIYYTTSFAALRIYIEIIIALALILTYSWQQKIQFKAAEEALKKHQLDYLETLEKAVQDRTQDLNTALESAHKANTAKVNFLGQITHDLRAPLTAILGYAQLQAVEAVTSQKANQVIQDRALYMKDMIDGLVDYTKDITTQENELHDIYLIAFIDNLVNQAHLLANKQGNRFQLTIETEIPTVIRCNSTQLQRVLLNLLDNAAKYTQQGNISLTIAASYQQDGKRWLSFQVSDTGSGMKPQQLEKIYTPFYRASESSPGSGLGLAICFELTEKLGGELQFTSQLGKGTQANFSLPCVAGDEQQVTPVLPAVHDLLPAFNAQGQTAWVIDDSLQIRELLDIQLQEMGFKNKLLASAEAVEEALNQNPSQPAVIITDYQLPKASGRAVLEVARKKWPKIPVILLTGTQSCDRQEAVDEDSERFCAQLSKPIDLLELRLKLAEVCHLIQKDY
ncbi:ATP-binding protein [Marinospirillum insulare]|uniref:ATP-binding protein n=1 Tax=Marinospirillum insulare TaxID=217169 RepID=UPI001FDF4377|nr:ATP-binding protein [Marinospirillum insulare]